MRTIEFEGEEVQVPDTWEEATALTQAKLESLPPDFFDKSNNPRPIFITINKTEYIVSLHYNQNAKRSMFEILAGLILRSPIEPSEDK